MVAQVDPPQVLAHLGPHLGLVEHLVAHDLGPPAAPIGTEGEPSPAVELRDRGQLPVEPVSAAEQHGGTPVRGPR